jgi:hypothetical protein
MPDMESTEFNGGGVQRNTIFPKGVEALTPADKLRLGYITGVEDDPNSQPHDGQFVGAGRFDQTRYDEATRDLVAQRQALQRAEAERYRESPY